MFGRGQAWALEGLIPAYKILKEENLKKIIEETINTLINVQLKNGGYAYNLTNPLLGEDCKAVSVLAKNMMDWFYISKNPQIKESATKALHWCCKHTATEKKCYRGGFFLSAWRVQLCITCIRHVLLCTLLHTQLNYQKC